MEGSREGIAKKRWCALAVRCPAKNRTTVLPTIFFFWATYDMGCCASSSDTVIDEAHLPEMNLRDVSNEELENYSRVLIRGGELDMLVGKAMMPVNLRVVDAAPGAESFLTWDEPTGGKKTKKHECFVCVDEEIPFL